MLVYQGDHGEQGDDIEQYVYKRGAGPQEIGDDPHQGQLDEDHQGDDPDAQVGSQRAGGLQGMILPGVVRFFLHRAFLLSRGGEGLITQLLRRRGRER